MRKITLLVIMVFGMVSLSGSKRQEPKQLTKDINASLDGLNRSLDSINRALDEGN